LAQTPSALKRSGGRDLPEGLRVWVKIVEGPKGPEVGEVEPE
jgi:cold shock CspA family protein